MSHFTKLLKTTISSLNRLMRIVKREFWTALIQRTCKKFGKGLTVNAKSWMGSNVIIGNNCHFNGIKVSSGGKVCIGNNFHCGSACQIIVQFHNYDSGKAIPYDDSVINKSVIIEDNVWLGYHIIILGSVHVGEGAIIQAGSVVVTDIPKYAIAGGNPARVFKMRNIDHYEKLKKQEKFH